MLQLLLQRNTFPKGTFTSFVGGIIQPTFFSSSRQLCLTYESISTKWLLIQLCKHVEDIMYNSFSA